ncbi:MAG: isoprenyl transferase [Bacteroidia bacterium]|nr:isoprenyl transferase [Bacteroidia bacterium]
MSFKEQIAPANLPQHVAIIMDGNGRWARTQGNARVFGHKSAIKAVRDTTEAAAELGIKFLTLFAFSTENWNRPKAEVAALMQLLMKTIQDETPTLIDNDVKLNAVGHIHRLPGNCQKMLAEAMKITANNQRMTLTLALSYGSRTDISDAVRKIAEAVKAGKLQPEEINDSVIGRYLSTAGMPDPELLIRTSGEYRISNFLLWEIAYSEIFFTEKFWPDFRREDLYEAIADFQGRERRFGKISEQIQSN